MKDSDTNTQGVNLQNFEPKKESRLPFIALGLDMLPLALFFSGGGGIISAILIIVAILSPIAGLIVGIAALRQPKQLDTFGKIVAIIAIILPLIFILCMILIIIFLINVATGNVTFM